MHNRIDYITGIIHTKILNSDITTIDFEDILIGKLGLAYSCFCIYKVNKDERYLNKVLEIIENIFDTLSKGQSALLEKPSLADGMPGLGIVLHELIKADILDHSYIGQLDMITDSIYKRCLNELSQNNFDYFYGATGLLFYLNKVETTKEVEHIVNVLYDHGVKNNFSFYNKVEDVYSQGINFGFAHGTLSIIAVLMNIKSNRIEETKVNHLETSPQGIPLGKNISISRQTSEHSNLDYRVKKLVLETTNTLLKFKRGNIDSSHINIMHENFDYDSIFPYNIITKNKNQSVTPTSVDTLYHYTNRLGWCNSDLSRLFILYKAGAFLNQQNYTRIADEMADEVIDRKLIEDTAISDAYICHGSSGVAHLYKKIYDRTHQSRYKEAYEYWIAITLDYMEQELKKQYSDKNLDVLTGWLGPLFVLSSYQKEEYQGWDSIFLLD